MPLRFVPHPDILRAGRPVPRFALGRIGLRHLPYCPPPRTRTHVAVGRGSNRSLRAVHPRSAPSDAPRGALLLTILTVVYLADTWRLERKSRYLLAAGALTGALALPMHTNASIAYLFLAVFALWHVRSLKIPRLALSRRRAGDIEHRRVGYSPGAITVRPARTLLQSTRARATASRSSSERYGASHSCCARLRCCPSSSSSAPSASWRCCESEHASPRNGPASCSATPRS